jgi:hypothetical protein
MRKQPLLATAVAVLALVIAMTGTAIATVIVTSNDQIAPHTVAGVNAPAGDNQNLIPGSVGRSDLHGNAVTGAKVANDSITGADIDESSLQVASVIADPSGGVLAVDGLSVATSTPYPLASATFTQRPGEIVEFVPQIETTLATPPNSKGTLCQVEIDLNVDGNRLAPVRSAGTTSDQLATTTVAEREDSVLPTSTASTTHTVTASALVANNGLFTNACSTSSSIDAFELHVIGTR